MGIITKKILTKQKKKSKIINALCGDAMVDVVAETVRTK